MSKQRETSNKINKQKYFYEGSKINAELGNFRLHDIECITSAKSCFLL